MTRGVNGHSMEDTIYVFSPDISAVAHHKSEHPDFNTEDKVFFHMVSPCHVGYQSYSADTLNGLYTDELEVKDFPGVNAPSTLDSMKYRMISLMSYMQQIYETGEIAETAQPLIGREKALEQYPERYLLLVNGLSEDALDAIAEYDLSHRGIPNDTGKRFVEKLRQHREELRANTPGAGVDGVDVASRLDLPDKSADRVTS